MPSESNDHDILLELKTDVCWIKKIVGNHLRHHWMVTLAALAAALSSIGTLIIFLIKGAE